MLQLAAFIASICFALLTVAFIIAGTCYALWKLGLFRQVERETLNTKRIEDIEGAMMTLKQEVDRIVAMGGMHQGNQPSGDDREVIGAVPWGQR